MTDYIEQMMEMVGCKTRLRGCTNDDVNEYTDYIFNDCEGDCEDCTWYDPDEYYPDFTAEKQLEIIKLIMKIEHFTLVDKEVSVTSMKNKNIGMWCKDATSYSLDFTQALAQLTNELMRSGELDKEKVKEILQ